MKSPTLGEITVRPIHNRNKRLDMMTLLFNAALDSRKWLDALLSFTPHIECYSVIFTGQARRSSGWLVTRHQTISPLYGRLGRVAQVHALVMRRMAFEETVIWRAYYR